MWDSKSEEAAANLSDRIKHFDAYLGNATMPVPIFLVNGPSFAGDSGCEAIRYRAGQFNRAFTCATSGELRESAEEWATSDNK